MIYKIVATVFSFLLFTASAQAEVYSQYILYKSGAQTLPVKPDAAWRSPSNAYTAITIPFPFDRLNANGDRAANASVQVVWAANSSGGNTGVMLLACPVIAVGPSNPDNCQSIAFFAANNSGPASYTPGCVVNPGGAMPCRSDITAILNGLIQAGKPVYLAVSSFGNGEAGPLIWDVEFFVSWRN